MGPMRLPLLLLLLALCGGSVRAQVQESKMIDRILQPDMTLASPLQGKSFYSGKGSVDLTRETPVKDFYFVQKFSSKSFETKEFASRGYWQGDFQFATKAAYIKTDTAADKTFDTKAVPVKAAYESGKDYYSGKSAYPTKEAPEKGKTSQNHLDEMYKGKERMNIDQVRDLLNKPKW